MTAVELAGAVLPGAVAVEGGAGMLPLAAGGWRSGGLPQALRIPTINSTLHHPSHPLMTLLLLEALGAGLLLIGIIWWTMFAGRPDGNPPVEQPVEPEERKEPEEPMGQEEPVQPGNTSNTRNTGKPNQPGKPGSPDS